MRTSGIVGLVMWCWRRRVVVTVLAVLATLAVGWFASNTLGLDTDESKLIDNDLAFRKAEQAMSRAFPQNQDQLVLVVDAATPDRAEAAANALVEKLSADHDNFRSARRPGGTAFFRANGVLYLSVAELQSMADKLIEAEPLLGSLARDPSLRGLMGALDLFVEGMDRGQASPADVAPALKRVADVAETVADGKPKPLDWTRMLGPDSVTQAPRAIVLTQPEQEFGELVPGAKATEAVRKAQAELGLTADKGYAVHLTGSVALTDDNFRTVTEGVELSTPLSIGAVLILLFLAVRSPRVVGSILVTLVVGLVATAGFAAATVKTLNPISVAFAVMFVGIAVDFAIQFTIRFRDEQTKASDDRTAMIHCARQVIAPLSLAAASTAVGFLSFLPTAYAGVSQLGLVAGGGMLIALVIDLTLLPALLGLAPPKPEAESPGLPGAHVLDRFLERRARAIVLVAVALGLAGAALLPFLKLDFDPLHVQNPEAESVATLMNLAKDPDTSPYTVDVLALGVREAQELADRLDKLPQVSRTATLASLVPEEQPAKLAILADAAIILGPVLDPANTVAPPSQDEELAALENTAQRLKAVKADPDGQAARLASALERVHARGAKGAAAFADAMLGGLPAQLDDLRRLLNARPVTLESLPKDLVDDWRTADGRVRVTAWPKGDMTDRGQLLDFVNAIHSVAPDATGMPVSIVEAGRVVVGSFVKAGLTALLAVAVLLGLMLRRVLDAVLVVVPLVLGALYTVIGCVAMGLAINFANIIALPLLLGIGIAFNIYFVVNWRQGVTDHLSTATSRAVAFSALTTSSAFGSLAVSPHVGTASMGLLLFLSVGLSVLTTFVVLPAIFHLLKGRRS